jgi:Tfp pilus assembly protein PilF
MTFDGLKPVMSQRKAIKNTSYISDTRNESPKTTPQNTNIVKSEKKKESDSTKKSSSQYGKIKLKANVENARISVDNKTLGAGNNTYSKIKSGTRTVRVSKDGYTEYKEVVKVKAGKTITITVNLSPEAPASLSAKDHLSLGKDALKEKDYSKAIDNLTQAVELSPNLAEAYETRATAFLQAGEKNKALSDYVRAGEIYRFKKKYDESNNAFSLALEISGKNTNALIGRAGTYLASGKYRSAMKDYNVALKTNNLLYAAQYGMGICHFKLGDNKKAEKYLKNAYKLDKSDPQLYQYLMLNYLARDNIKKVREVYSEFKAVADPAQLAELKSSSQFQPVIRLIKEENR